MTIKTAFSVIFDIIGLLSLTFFLTFLYLMYKDPEGLITFASYVNMITDPIADFFQNFTNQM